MGCYGEGSGLYLISKKSQNGILWAIYSPKGSHRRLDLDLLKWIHLTTKYDFTYKSQWLPSGEVTSTHVSRQYQLTGAEVRLPKKYQACSLKFALVITLGLCTHVHYLLDTDVHLRLLSAPSTVYLLSISKPIRNLGIDLFAVWALPFKGPTGGSTPCTPTISSDHLSLRTAGSGRSGKQVAAN